MVFSFVRLLENNGEPDAGPLAQSKGSRGGTAIGVKCELMFDASRALPAIGSGSCACSGCGGLLTDSSLSKGGWGFCQVCRCAWKVSTIDGHEYATTIPAPAHAGV